MSNRRHYALSSPSSPRGFTLVELLVVIGVIALLIAILLPVLGKARAQANRLICQSNVRQLALGINLYCNDNRDWYPTAAYWKTTGFVQFPDDWIYWEANRRLDDSPLAHYLGIGGQKLISLLRCPMDVPEAHKPFPGISAGQGAYLYSYGVNENVGANLAAPQWWRSKRGQWRRAAEKVLITECLSPNCGVWSNIDTLTRRHGSGVSRQSGATIGINVSAAFMDGHVESVNGDFTSDFRQMQLDQ